MLSELGNRGSTLAELNNKISFDSNNSSMGKQKQERQNPTQPSPASKAAQKARRKKAKEEEEAKSKSKKDKKDKLKEKLKPSPRSGLEPTPPSAPILKMTGPTTRHSPRKAAPTTLPEGTPLLPNLNINPDTGLPRTSEVEKRVISKLLVKRKGKPPTKDLKEEMDEEPPTKAGRHQKIWWPRNVLQEGSVVAARGDQGKVGCLHPHVQAKRCCPRRCHPRKILAESMWEGEAILEPMQLGDFNMAQVIIPQTPKAIHSTNMAEECSEMMRNNSRGVE